VCLLGFRSRCNNRVWEPHSWEVSKDEKAHVRLGMEQRAPLRKKTKVWITSKIKMGVKIQKLTRRNKKEIAMINILTTHLSLVTINARKE
jgi:hypothetical protein